MNKNTKIYILAGGLLAILGGAWYLSTQSQQTTGQTTGPGPTSTSTQSQPSITSQQTSSSSSLQNQNGQTVSSSQSYTQSSSSSNPILGSALSPYNASSGWQGPGYYNFPSQLFSIPASGITYNPVYVTNADFISGAMAWLQYTSSTGQVAPTGSSETTTTVQPGTVSGQSVVTTITQTSPSSEVISQRTVSGGYITVTPTTIDRTPNTGQVITIDGYNFHSGEKGFVAMSDIQIAGFTASSNGTWTATAQNTMTQAAVSGLWNAIQDTPGSSGNIYAYGYSGTGATNKVPVSLV